MFQNSDGIILNWAPNSSEV